MNFLSDIYNKKLAETEKSFRFWENYLQDLTSLAFNVYSDKLTVPALVPIGSRIFFKGELKHTNEVTVALGADYFAKCSLQQAEVLRQHRIKDALAKMNMYKREKEYLENQISFSKENLEGTEEIIENYIEDEDRAWREKHRENMRLYKQEKGKQEMTEDVITDDELWNRLEELELQEELENELLELNVNNHQQENTFVIKDKDNKNSPTNIEMYAKESNHTLMQPDRIESYMTKDQISSTENEVQNIEDNEKHKVLLDPMQTPKPELLQRVIDKQNELENMFLEIRNSKTNQIKTENDLISKLDEYQKLDEIEDEMERLDDVLAIKKHNENDNDNSKLQNTVVKRCVSFADQDDSETLDISFKHSDVEPCHTPYDPEKGILKPSDIYEAYASTFGEATSILKKTKYNTDTQKVQKTVVAVEPETRDPDVKIIIISDIKERVANQGHKAESKSRPTSIFKKIRMQNK